MSVVSRCAKRGWCKPVLVVVALAGFAAAGVSGAHSLGSFDRSTGSVDVDLQGEPALLLSQISAHLAQTRYGTAEEIGAHRLEARELGSQLKETHEHLTGRSVLVGNGTPVSERLTDLYVGADGIDGLVYRYLQDLYAVLALPPEDANDSALLARLIDAPGSRLFALETQASDRLATIEDARQRDDLRRSAVALLTVAAATMALVVGSLVMIQQRRRQNALRAAAQERMSMFFESLTTPMVMTDGSTKILAVNRAWCDLFGYDESEALGQSSLIIVKPEDRASVHQTITVAAASGAAAPTERVYVAKDGREIHALRSVVHLADDLHPDIYVLQITDVSALVALKEQTAQQAAVLEAIIDSSSVPLQITDAAGHYTRVNPATIDLLGKPVEQIIGTRGGDHLHPADLERLHEDVRALRAGTIDQVDSTTVVVRPDGTSRRVVVRARALRSADGALTGIVAQMNDVTELLEARDAALASESRQRALVEALPDTVMVVDDDLTYEWIHVPSGDLSARANSDEMVGMTVLQVHGEQAATQLRTALDDSRATGTTSTYMSEITRSDGARQIRDVRVQALDGRRGLVVSRNVTTERDAQRRAERAESELRGLFGALPDAVTVFDGDLNYEFVHLPGGEETSISVDQIHGRTMEEVNGLEYAAPVRAAAAEAASTGQVVRFDLEMTRRSGRREIRDVRVVHLGGDRTLVVTREVTEERSNLRRAETSEMQVRSLLAALPDSVTVLTDDGVVIDDHRGYGVANHPVSSALIGRHVLDLFGPAATQRFQRAVNQVRATGTADPFDYKSTDLSGELAVFEARVGVLDDDHVIVLSREVTGIRADAAALADREARLSLITESAPQVIALMDIEGRIVTANHRWTDVTGMPVAESLGYRFMKAIHPDDAPLLLDAGVAALRGGQAYAQRVRLLHTDGSERWVDVRNSPYLGADGAVLGAVCSMSDVTEEIALTRERDRLANVLEASSDLVVITDLTGGIVYANPTAQTTMGDTDRFESILTLDSRRVYTYDVVPEVYRFGGWTGELSYLMGDDAIAVSVLAVAMRDEHGEVESVAHIARDITALKEAEARLAHLATHDWLTGLPNRSLFMDRLTTALNRSSRQATTLAVLFIDLDGFKAVNDTLGHEAGDDLLVEVAARLGVAVRAVDTVARLGGDEFVVLCEAVESVDVARSVAERILESVARPFDVSAGEAIVGCSIGLVTSDGTEDAATLLAGADLAMYDAKRAGKGRIVELHTVAEMTPRADTGARRMMSSALVRNEFSLVHMPVLDLENRSTTSFEALLRWRHPDLGVMFPIDVVPLATDAGLLTDLTEFVLTSVHTLATRLGTDGPPHSVNLSLAQLTTVDLPAMLAGIWHLDPSRLGLEIDEPEFTDPVTRAVVDQLAREGYSIILDDFGTGATTLSHWREVGVTTVKLSSSEVGDLAGPDPLPTSDTMASVVHLARELGVTVVAKHIERPEWIPLVRATGVLHGQGFGVHPSISDGEVLELVYNAMER